MSEVIHNPAFGALIYNSGNHYWEGNVALPSGQVLEVTRSRFLARSLFVVYKPSLPCSSYPLP